MEKEVVHERQAHVGTANAGYTNRTGGLNPGKWWSWKRFRENMNSQDGLMTRGTNEILGHEQGGLSRNNDFNTVLNSHESISHVFGMHKTKIIFRNWRNFRDNSKRIQLRDLCVKYSEEICICPTSRKWLQDDQISSASIPSHAWKAPLPHSAVLQAGITPQMVGRIPPYVFSVPLYEKGEHRLDSSAGNPMGQVAVTSASPWKKKGIAGAGASQLSWETGMMF